MYVCVLCIISNKLFTSHIPAVGLCRWPVLIACPSGRKTPALVHPAVASLCHTWPWIPLDSLQKQSPLYQLKESKKRRRYKTWICKWKLRENVQNLKNNLTWDIGASWNMSFCYLLFTADINQNEIRALSHKSLQFLIGDFLGTWKHRRKHKKQYDNLSSD